MDIRARMRSRWKDKCTIYGYQGVLNANMSTTHEEIIVLKDEPCRLSFSKSSPANQTDTVAETPQTVKLFICETLDIKPGSKMVITRRNGKVYTFAHSGEVAVYDYNQEIVLTPLRGLA